MRKMEHYLHFPLTLLIVISIFAKLSRSMTVTSSFSQSSSSSSSSNGGPAKHTFSGSTSWNNNGKKGGDKFAFAWKDGQKGGKPPPGLKLPGFDMKPPPMPNFDFPDFPELPGFPQLPGFGNPFDTNKKKPPAKKNNKKPPVKKPAAKKPPAKKG